MTTLSPYLSSTPFFRVALKQDELADAALTSALQYAPEDAAIKKEKNAVQSRKKAQLQKQKAAYSKMFG